MQELRPVEFDEALAPHKRARLRKSPLYRRYLAERRRVGRLAAATLLSTGALCDPALIGELEALRAMEPALLRLARSIKDDAEEQSGF